MKMMRSVLIASVAALLSWMPPSAAMAKEEAKNIGNVVRAIKEITAIKKEKIPPAMIKDAIGIAIFPEAAKNDFMVKGRSAKGILLLHDKEGKWSNPLFVTLNGGTLGWQMVGNPMDIVMVFKNMKRIDEIMKGKLYMDIKVSVVPGPIGLTMKAATKQEQQAEINSYVRSHGVFADVSVASATVQIDDAANEAFYGHPKISAGDIVTGKVEKSSDDFKNLQKLLTEYADGK
jgi:lipid-binding SYLF domain-containing protein